MKRGKGTSWILILLLVGGNGVALPEKPKKPTVKKSQAKDPRRRLFDPLLNRMGSQNGTTGSEDSDKKAKSDDSSKDQAANLSPKSGVNGIGGGSRSGSGNGSSGTTTNVYDDQGKGGEVEAAAPDNTKKKDVSATPTGGGNGANKTSAVIPSLYMPICFIVPPGMPEAAVNAVVKANADSYGACDIAMQPFVFRANDIPDSAGAISSMAPQVCPLNSELGVGGSAVQVFAPFPKTADEMCKIYEYPNGVKTLAEKTAGCSVVGNGNSGGSVASHITGSGSGYGGGGNTSGSPAVSIVDSTAKYSPETSCHELGHSNGGPGRGGDFLVNKGDGKPQPAGQGLLAAGAGEGLEAQSMPGSPAGDVENGQCSFTKFGCDSLKGGSNPNTKQYPFDKKKQDYFAEPDKGAVQFSLMAGRNFFRYKNPAPSGSNIAGGVPRNRGGGSQGSSRSADEANLESTPAANSPHKKGVTSGEKATDPGSVKVGSRQKLKVIESDPEMEIGKNNSGPGSAQAADRPPVELGPVISSQQRYDDAAQYKSSGGGGGGVSVGGTGPSNSSSGQNSSSASSIGGTTNIWFDNQGYGSNVSGGSGDSNVSGGFGRSPASTVNQTPKKKVAKQAKGKKSPRESALRDSESTVRTIQPGYSGGDTAD